MQYRAMKSAMAAGTALWLAQSAAAFGQAPSAADAGATSVTAPGAAAATPGAAAVSPAGPPAPAASSASAAAAVGEVVVTARRTQERLQDVPISITVFNQQQLANRNITQAIDLATYTPSLSVNTFFGSENTVFSIRGFNQQFGTAPTVGVYFADVIAPRAASNNLPIGDGAGPGSFFDLQNVQVLKGPQGTLFGLNTTGGAILLVPQKPTDKFEGYVEGSYGDYDMKRLQAVVNLPVNDNVRFRVGVDHESRNGYLTNTTGIGPTKFDDIDYTAVRGSLDVNITPQIENYTIFSYLNSETNGDLQSTYVADPTSFFGGIEATSLQKDKQAGFYQTQNFIPDASTRQRQWQIIDTASWRANENLTVKDIISYSQLVENIKSSLFGSDIDFSFSPLFGGLYAQRQAVVGLADIYPISNGDTANQSTFTNEFQVQGAALDRRLIYQGGVYYERSDPLGLTGSQSDNLIYCTSGGSLICGNPIGAGNVSITNGKTTYTDLGIYIQSTYSITPKLKLTGGFRYTSDHTSTTGQQYAYQYNSPLVNPGLALFPNPPTASGCTNPDLVPPACVVAYKESSSAPTGLVDLDYKPIQDLLLYAKYSRGYREGGVNPTVPTEFAIFQPEHLNAYELGLKSTLRDPLHATFDVAVFYNDLSNEQVQVNFLPAPGASGARQSGALNANSSSSYGAEFEGSITPLPGLTVGAAYTYIDAKIRSIPTFATTATSLYYAQAPAESGDPEAFTPKNKASVTVNYELPISRDIGRISVGGDFNFIDRQVTNYASRINNAQTGPLTGDSFIPSQRILDLNLNWRSVVGRPVDLSVFATNVTDVHYFSFYTGLLQSSGFDTGTVGPPRMYGVRLRYHFGS